MIPQQIKVGGYTWYIHQEKDDFFTDCEGYMIREKHRIYIKKSLPEDRKHECLIHELLHVLFDFAHLTQDIDDDLEEKIVRRLATPLHMLLSDNEL